MRHVYQPQLKPSPALAFARAATISAMLKRSGAYRDFQRNIRSSLSRYRRQGNHAGDRYFGESPEGGIVPRQPPMAPPREPDTLSRMEVEIVPEPPEEVRRAIEVALAPASPADAPGAWWRAGLEDAGEDRSDATG